MISSDAFQTTGPDTSRPVATSPDQYTLTIEDVAKRYEHAGHPRTLRSIQRYCFKGHLDCLRQETTFGDKYLITPESVARHISQIEELSSATNRDVSRQVATDNDMPPRYVAQLEREVERLNEDRNFLRDQIKTKDTQIAALLDRDHETNILVQGLQRMLSPLLGSGREQNRPQQGDEPPFH